MFVRYVSKCLQLSFKNIKFYSKQEYMILKTGGPRLPPVQRRRKRDNQLSKEVFSK